MESCQILFSKKRRAIVWLTAIFGLMHPSLLTVECDEASAESSSFSTFDHLSRLFFAWSPLARFLAWLDLAVA
jgi:hypothetical protein